MVWKMGNSGRILGVMERTIALTIVVVFVAFAAIYALRAMRGGGKRK